MSSRAASGLIQRGRWPFFLLAFEVMRQLAAKTLGEQHIAVFFSFALFDTNQHSLGIDVADLHGGGFGDAQARAVAEHQSGAVLQAGHAVEEPGHFFRRQHDRQTFGDADARKALLVPRHFQRHGIKKLNRRNKRVDALWRQLSLVQQMDLVLPDGFQIELLRARVIELREVAT